MTLGHVKLSRKMFDGHDDLWSEPRVFSRAEAWIDLIQLAAFKPHRKLIGNQFVDLKRGEILASIRFLAERWGWGRDRVSLFLGLLENMDRLRTARRTPSGTVYHLVKYEDYQTSSGGKSDRKPDAASDSYPTGTRQVPDKENTRSTRSSGSKILDQNLEQEHQPSVPSERGEAPEVGSALVLVSESRNGVEITPGEIAQALVARCCEIHAAAGVEIAKRDRGQWGGIAKRLALERSPEQVCFAVAGMDHGGGKLWRFNAENPDRVPWNLFHLEQFFTSAVAAGRVQLEGPQRAEDDFMERVRRRAETLQ